MKRKLIKKIRDALLHTHVFDRLYALRPHHLTVLAYHRITDADAPDFVTYRPNVSASPAMFAAQMDYIRQYFNIISLHDLLAWLRSEAPLPRHPLLITFDDGYRDNFTHALPVLRERNMPAVIFLTTDHIGSSTPFWWDLVAFCFTHTPLCEADLPLIGRQQWSDTSSRTQVMECLLAKLKEVPEAAKLAAVERLPDVLQVTIPSHAFAEMFLTWDHVRQMVAQRVAMGAHTQNHPIMTRIPLAQARSQARNAKTRIEAEIGQPVTTFAYTNGQASDFDSHVQDMLCQEGFAAAFTLLPGPAHPAAVRQNPLAIRRVAVNQIDTVSRLALKLLRRH
jgi:peptidoglycan/xylan/chitin deacetylase (PgdA/CDA1 family)